MYQISHLDIESIRIASNIALWSMHSLKSYSSIEKNMIIRVDSLIDNTLYVCKNYVQRSIKSQIHMVKDVDFLNIIIFKFIMISLHLDSLHYTFVYFLKIFL